MASVTARIEGSCGEMFKNLIVLVVSTSRCSPAQLLAPAHARPSQGPGCCRSTSDNLVFTEPRCSLHSKCSFQSSLSSLGAAWRRQCS
ncbi:hypothetical protein GHK03_02590 [Sinorhizobium medicae]|nr:hypothetical protein [Sinorhizobium medicae]